MGQTCSTCGDCTPCGGDEREVECNTDYMKDYVCNTFNQNINIGTN